jgi:sugar/nucleoside kinase (ribokinase family)
MVKLFTAGGVIIDNVVAANGTVHQNAMGGNAVYSAAGARLWLDDVGIVAVVPKNYPKHWLDELGRSGIDVAGISVVDRSVECTEWFFYRSDGSRVDHLYAAPGTYQAFGLIGSRLTRAQAAAFEAHLRSLASSGSVNRNDFASFRCDHPVRYTDVPTDFRFARGVHLAPNAPAAQLSMARQLHAPDRQISLDPGSNAAEIAAGPLAELLGLVAAILPSEKELAALVPDVTREEALTRLVQMGAPVALVKLATAGCMFSTRHASGFSSVPVIPIQAQDPTGAGDAFCGGFLAGLVATNDPLCAAVCGTVSASFAVESFGPFHLLGASRTEAVSRFRTLALHVELPRLEEHLQSILL